MILKRFQNGIEVSAKADDDNATDVMPIIRVTDHNGHCLLVNSKHPVKYETDLFDGYLLLIVADPLKEEHSNYLLQRKVHFELQLQVQF